MKAVGMMRTPSAVIGNSGAHAASPPQPADGEPETGHNALQVSCLATKLAFVAPQ
jgi:hypothetical protein